MMREGDVREAVRGLIAAKYAGPGTRVVEEMGIWSGSARIDLAVINGQLHGFELKSERDTLIRLRDQAELYSEVFDRMTLVVATKHLEKAMSGIPQWWGVSEARFSVGVTSLCEIRKSEQNPNVNPLQVARLLWRDEALAILERRQLSKGVKSKTVDVILARLVEHLSLDELSREVRDILKTRRSWLGEPISN